jgi:hypothetical protein
MEALKAANCDPRSKGPGAYESKCPAHEGKRHNLSIKLGDDGKVLLHCHHVNENGSGCSTSAIVQSLGLRLEDLWPKSNGPAPKSSGKRSWKTPEEALRAVASKIEPKPIKSQSWTYHDAHGSLVMVVGRFDAANGEKTYRPVHILPDGSWSIGDPPGRLPLYELPDVLDADLIVVLEGERCADAARAAGFATTTSAHGAESPHKTDWSPLAGKSIVIIPDHDVSGEGYAASVLRLLKRLDPRPRVKVVRLPGLADGEDFVEWSAQIAGEGPKHEATEAIRFELTQLCRAVEPVDLDAIEAATSEAPRQVTGSPEIEASIPIPDWPDPPGELAFYGLAGEVVRLIEPTSEADPVGVLLQLLIGFGNVIGSGLSIIADGHNHHANEYVVTVGDTSRARKGTAYRRVRPILTHVDLRWAENRVAHGLSSGEGLIWEVRDPIYGTDKQTGQPKIIDPGVDDKRVLIVEQEFGNVLRVLARDGNTLSGVLRLGWDGDDLRTMTKHSPARASKPHVSLAGHITQQELAKYLSAVEVFGGLGNRILWASVRRSKLLPFSGSANGREIERLGSRLAAAADLARVAGTIVWTSTASALWESEYANLTENRPGLWGAITSRGEAHVLRLSMIFAVLDKSAEIVDTHVLAALELWRYCDRAAAYLFGGSVGDRDADSILDALRARSGGMTRTEIRDTVFQRNKTSDEIVRALALLLRFGLAQSEQVQTEGRPAERWFATNAEGTRTR